MWTRQILGVDSYHIIHWFLIYSVLGWCVESIYMSFCNRRITNRGFATGPFCPIYGFGALSVYFLLRPFQGHYAVLYIFGAVIATTFEYLVARLMQWLFGQVWWDYNDKPFNYQGILCLESSIAWGFYTLFLFTFLQRFVEFVVDSYPIERGIFLGKIVILVSSLDICHSLYVEKRDVLPFTVEDIKELLLSGGRN